MSREESYVSVLKRLPLKSQSAAERRCKDIDVIMIDQRDQRHTYESDSMSDSKKQFDNNSDNNMSGSSLLDIFVVDDDSTDISYQSTNRLLSISPISSFDVSSPLPNVIGRLFQQTVRTSCTHRCAHDCFERCALLVLPFAAKCWSLFRRVS